VLVDPTGWAHIAWTVDGGEMYCRLPRGATGCDVKRFLPLTNTNGPVTILRRPDGVLLMVQDTRDIGLGGPYGTTWLRESPDDGVTWQGPSAIATGAYGHSATALSVDGQSVFTLAPTAGGVVFQRAGLTGEQTRVLHLGDMGPGPARLLVLPDGRMIVATAQWSRVFNGGDPYDITRWSPPADFGGPELATGPRGTFMLSARTLARQTKDNNSPFILLPYDRGWGKSRRFGSDAQVGPGGAALAEDASGRLHVLAASPGCLLYTRTSPKGVFGRTTTLVRLGGTPASPGLGAAPDGRGVAVWTADRHVFVAKLQLKRGAYEPIRLGRKRPACP
jgi:hypothetical protein